MSNDWFQASLDGDVEGAAKIQERVARAASEEVKLPLKDSMDRGLESLLPDARVPAPRDHFYDAFQRLDAIMGIGMEGEKAEKTLVQNYAPWQASLASQFGRENWAMSDDGATIV